MCVGGFIVDSCFMSTYRCSCPSCLLQSQSSLPLELSHCLKCAQKPCYDCNNKPCYDCNNILVTQFGPVLPCSNLSRHHPMSIGPHCVKCLPWSHDAKGTRDINPHEVRSKQQDMHTYSLSQHMAPSISGSLSTQVQQGIFWQQKASQQQR